MWQHSSERSQSSIIAAGTGERPFSGEYLPDASNAREAIASVLSRIASAEEAERARKRAEPTVTAKPRRRRKEAQHKFELAATAIVAELVVALASGCDGCLFVSRRKDFLEREDRYRSQAINPLLPAALDQLEALGFISQVKGHITDAGDRRRTVISPGPALTELMATYGLHAKDFRHERAGDEIVLKERGGETPIAYTDDGDTRRMRAEMQAINEFLRGADIGISLADAADPLDNIDLTKRKLRRVFSQGNFAEGGRLFGGFWQDLKGEQRRERLLIDGQQVAELDLSSAGLRILYGLAGAQPPDGDLYELPNLPAAKRGDVKSMIAALTFIDRAALPKLAPLAKRMRPARTGEHDACEFNRHMADMAAVEAVVDAIRQAHSPVAGYLPSLVGHRVQRVESDAMVSILLYLTGKQIVSLPVHDGLLVRHDHADLATAVMAKCFEAVTGVVAVVRVKPWGTEELVR
jgi:hypothetical protein